MKDELHNCFKKKESGVFGGFSREIYIQELVKYIVERYQKKKYSERPVQSTSIKKTRLSTYVNQTETTTLNRCTLCVVVPNAGLIAEIVSRLFENKSVLKEKDLKLSQYKIVGDENDDFILPLKYTEETGFEETFNISADIIILTTKALITLGDKKIDRKKYFIKEKEELVDFTRKVKNQLNIYAFLSGIDTTVFLDADILQIQNKLSVKELINIIKEAKPMEKQQLNLRYLSSGEEKKAFIFLANIITPEIIKIVEEIPQHTVISKSTASNNPNNLGSLKYPVQLILNKNTPETKYRNHHILNLSNEYEKVLIILKDSVELNQMKTETAESPSVLSNSIFFIDEYTPGNKIKDELKNSTKRVWVITERFIFYRRRRLTRILTPYNPVKVFAPHIVNPYILKIALNTITPQETEDKIYSAPVILTVRNDSEKYFINELFGKSVIISELFMYTDSIRIESK